VIGTGHAYAGWRTDELETYREEGGRMKCLIICALFPFTPYMVERWSVNDSIPAELSGLLQTQVLYVCMCVCVCVCVL